MTYKKLQNTLFYTYAWSIALWNENYRKNDLCKIFEADWLAAAHGARSNLIKNKFSQYGFREINKSYALTEFDENTLNLLKQIETTYVQKFSGIKLDSLVRQELPYVETRKIKYSKLSDKIIFDYYSRLVERS